jgi:EamA domain-containing membrane protein RarD
MDTSSEQLATIAIGIGLYQMLYHFKKVYESEDLNGYTVEYIVSGIIASLLWTIYQHRKGANMSAIYSAASLFLGMYTLLKMLKSTPTNKKEE